MAKNTKNAKKNQGRGRKKRHRKAKPTIQQKNDIPADRLSEFFDQYPDFDYDPTASSSLEFYRMCKFFNWNRKDSDRDEAHEDFKIALVEQFNDMYGTDEDDIRSWRGLCNALNIDPQPENVKAAKEVFASKFVNLVDLIDGGRSGLDFEEFEDLESLRQYTIETGKYFPKDSAYAGGMLRYLLREILHTR